jgi:16S rRNA (cytidine1402-2'-O)-methyltransferase
MAGTLFVVATPIGNLEDISARALRVLREVALIAAEDTRRTAKLLSRHGISTPTTSLHAHNEHQKRAELVGRLAAGDHVALVSDAGTPTVADPGALLVGGAAAAGIKIEPIPGPSAITTLLSAAGFTADSFSFLGFPPTSQGERAAWFDRLLQIGGCVVFYEAPHRIKFTLEDLRRVAGDVPVVAGRELTKAHEEILRGSVSDVLERLTNPVGEFAVVANIGHVANIGAVSRELSAEEARKLFGQLTDSGGLTRRRAIAKLSRDYNLTARQVFDLLEQAKG